MFVVVAVFVDFVGWLALIVVVPAAAVGLAAGDQDPRDSSWEFDAMTKGECGVVVLSRAILMALATT